MGDQAAERRLSVLVVCYRRTDLLRRCLNSVERHLPGAPVLVWDNHSETSQRTRLLATEYPQVRWTFSERNIGFAAAVNRLAAACRPDDLLLLNPDAELVGPLAGCRAALRLPETAAVSPLVLDPGGGQQPWDVAHRRTTLVRALVGHAGYAGRLRRLPVSDLYPDPPDEVDGYLTGCCLLVSRQAWSTVGEFDERYFVYGEEADWQRRARQAGWRLRLVPEPDVRHGGHGTTAGDPVIAEYGRDLLRTGQVMLLGRRGNGGPGALFAAGTALLDRVQRSKRSRRAALGPPATAHAVVLTTNTLTYGGAERQRVLLANELAARGHPVTVVCLQQTGPLRAELDPAVRVTLQPWWLPATDLPPGPAVLVTGVTNTEAGFATGWRLGGRGRRWLFAPHDPAEPDRPTYSAALAAVLRRSDGAIALAQRHWDELNTHHHLHDTVFFAANGALPVAEPAGEPPRRAAPGEPLRLGMLSRITERKKPQLLVAALAELAGLPWTLDILGDGPDRARLQALTPPSVADRVRWRGWISGPDEGLAGLDLLCVPSGFEAFPMVIVEAMLRGLPVIASQSGAVGEMLDGGRAGIVVHPVTVAAWVDALRPVLTDPAILRPLARNGLHRAREHYTVDRMADAYQAAFAAVLDLPVPSGRG